MKRVLSLVVLLMAMCGIVSAQDVETWTFVPTKALGITGNGQPNNVTLSDMAWTVTFDCKTTSQKDSYTGGSNANLQFGTNNAKLNSLTLSTDGFAGKLIAKVVVNCSNASKDAGVALTVNVGSYSEEKALTASSTDFADYTYEPNVAADNLKLLFVNSAAKGGVKIHSITVYTQTESDSRADVTLQWSQSELKVSEGEQITPPSLLVNPAEARGEVKFSTSDAGVASVADDGSLTVAGIGTATITASIIDSETYKDVSASYKVTVVDPNEACFTLVFREKGSNATLVSSTTKPATIIKEGAELVSGFLDVSTVYYADQQDGLRFSKSGNSGVAGKLTINLLDDYAITRIEAAVTGWSSTESCPLTINGVTSDVAVGTASYVYAESARSSSIVIEATDKKKEFLQALTVYYSTVPVKESVATPEFDPAGGEVEAGTKVSISCGTEGAAIWYAVGDGEFVEYAEPIELTEAATLRAKATKEDMIDSEEATASYTIKVVDLREEAMLSWAQSDVQISLGEDFEANVLTVTPEEARGEVMFASTDESVVTVDADGSLTVVGAGSATITASIVDSETYKDASASYDVTVTDPSIVAVELSVNFFNYTQSAYNSKTATDDYGVTYSAVYSATQGRMAFNTGNANGGKASEIVVSANERMVIESITIDLNSGSVNVYANNEVFAATTKGQTPVVPESAVKLNEEAIAASVTVPVNARAFAIWPAAEKAQINKITVKYVYVPAPKHGYGDAVDAEHNDVFEFEASEGYKLYFRWQEVASVAAAGRRAAAAVGEWSEYSADNQPVFDHKRDMVLELKHVADNGAESNTTSIAVHYTGDLTGIGEVEADGGEVEFFDLRGVRVARPGQGIYLLRQGSVVSKVAVR